MRGIEVGTHSWEPDKDASHGIYIFAEVISYPSCRHGGMKSNFHRIRGLATFSL